MPNDAQAPMFNVQIDGVWAGRQLCAALLLSQETELAGKLPNVLDRNGTAKTRSGSQTGTRRRWQTSDQLDGTPANFLCSGRRRRNGRAHEFSAGQGMPARRDGISSH